MIAGSFDEVVEAGAFAAEDEDAVAGEVKLVVVGGAALVEADDPEIALFELFEGADKINDARDAEVLCRARAGFDSDRTERSRAAFSEDNSVDTSTICDAEESAEILGIFDAVECEKEAWAGGRVRGRIEEIFDGEEFLWADEGDNALVSSGSGQLRELVAGFLADTNASLFAIGDKAGKAVVLALASHQHMIETAPAGFESLFYRVHAVENVHGISVDGGDSGKWGLGAWGLGLGE